MHPNETAPPDSPKVILPPPFIYAGGLALGLLLNEIFPFPFLPERFAYPIGAALMAVSLALIAAAARALRNAKTNMDVRRPTTAIVTSGPYRFSRNPIYLSMTLFSFGATSWFNAFWMLLMLIPILALIRFKVIAREEAYLEKKFGEEYRRYRLSVRRWL